MTKRVSLNTSSVAIAIALLSIAIAEHATAQTTCPNPGERPAVASDAVVQSGQLPIGTCYNPNTLGVNQSTEQAKTYLLSLPRSGTAANNSGITDLNGSFAICAANFLKAFTSKYGSVTITSGYRSAAYDAAMCKNNPACGALENNPNPNGNHQKGLAMDINAGSNQTAMDHFAKQNPQFGVCFPFSLGGVTGAGKPDTVHMILAGIPGSEPQGAGCSGVTRACSAGNFNPNTIVTPAPTQPSQPLVTSQPQTPFTPQAPQGYCLTSTQPIIYTLCNTNSAQPTAQPAQVAQPATTAAQPIQQTAGSTPTLTQTPQLSTTASSPASSALSNLFQPTPFSLPPTSSSATQALNIMTNLGSYATSGTASLNQSLANIINNLIPGNATTTIQATSSISQPIPPVQDTFSSNPPQYTPTYTPQIDQILGSIKNVLLNILSYLRSL